MKRDAQLLLRLKQAAHYLGVSETTLWRLSKQPDFPEKVTFNSRCVGYYQEQLKAWALDQKRSKQP